MCALPVPNLAALTPGALCHLMFSTEIPVGCDDQDADVNRVRHHAREPQHQHRPGCDSERADTSLVATVAAHDAALDARSDVCDARHPDAIRDAS